MDWFGKCCAVVIARYPHLDHGLLVVEDVHHHQHPVLPRREHHAGPRRAPAGCRHPVLARPHPGQRPRDVLRPDLRVDINIDIIDIFVDIDIIDNE